MSGKAANGLFSSFRKEVVGRLAPGHINVGPDCLSRTDPPSRALQTSRSRDDPIVPAEHVEAWLARKRESGVPIRTLELATSPHCAHLRTAPTSYSAALRDLLDAVQ